MKAIAIAVGLTAMSAGACYAQDLGQWRIVHVERSIGAAYDVASLQRSGSAVTVRAIFSTRQSERIPRGRGHYDYRISQSRFDCERRTGTDLQVAYYSLDRQDSISERLAPGRARQLMPDSLEGQLMQYACGDVQPEHRSQTGESFTRILRGTWQTWVRRVE